MPSPNIDLSRCPDRTSPSASAAAHVLVMVNREDARIRRIAERLRREADVIVEVVQADLHDAVDLALVEGRLDRDSRVSVLVNNAGLTFIIAFPRPVQVRPSRAHAA